MKLNVEVIQYKQVEQEVDLPFYVKRINKFDEDFEILIFSDEETDLKLKILKFSKSEGKHFIKQLIIDNSFCTVLNDAVTVENLKRLNHIVSKLLSVKDDMFELKKEYEQLTKEQFEKEISNHYQ